MFKKFIAVALFIESSFIATLAFAETQKNIVSSPQVVTDQLKKRMPNWRPHIAEQYLGGATKQVIFFEPISKDLLKAVKRVSYYEDGKIAQEEDLLADTAVKIDDLKCECKIHGVSVSYFPTGSIKELFHFKEGKLHGPCKSFYSNGKLEQDYLFNEGVLQGKAESYYENGKLKSEAFYVDGKLDGNVATFYEDGKHASLKSYQEGVLNGSAMEWHENGLLKATRIFSKGLLHASQNAPAVVLYNDQEKVIEAQHFKNGVPQGLHQKFHDNSALSYQVLYTNGVKEGKEEFFSPEGTLLGGGEYRQGKPIKRHIVKYSDGLFQKIACYDDKGLLIKPIEEFYPNGQLKLRYSLDADYKFDKLYSEYFDNGKPKYELHYEHGQLQGEQKEYYESGKKKWAIKFNKGKQEGIYRQWHENGKLAVKAAMKDGLREGVFQEWYSDGMAKSQAMYQEGKLNGLCTNWYPNGKPAFEAHYLADQLDQSQKEYHENGTLILEKNYQNGIEHGLCQKWYDDGQLQYKVNFNQGKKEGEEQAYYKNGQLQLQAFYQDGKLHQTRTTWYENGQINSVGQFDLDRCVGLHQEFYESLDLASNPQLKVVAHFKEGKLDGLQEQYFPDGQTQISISYQNGLPHGRKASWNNQNVLVQEAFYEEGRLDGRYFSQEANQTEVVCHYKDNLKEGVYQIYYPKKKSNQKVKALEAHYKSDILEGECTEYNIDGHLVAQSFYKNGQKEGVAKIFNPDQTVKMTLEYVKGELHGKVKEFYPNGAIHKETFYEHGLKEGDENTYSENGSLIGQNHYKQGELDGYCYSKNDLGKLTFEAQYQNGKKHGKFNKYYDNGEPKVIQEFHLDQLNGVKKVYDQSGLCTETHYDMGDKLN